MCVISTVGTRAGHLMAMTPVQEVDPSTNGKVGCYGAAIRVLLRMRLVQS